MEEVDNVGELLKIALSEILNILQDKINTYLSYINSKQYADVYPGKDFSKYLINIYFLHQLTDNFKKYIDVVNRQLSVDNIEVVPEVSKPNQ